MKRRKRGTKKAEDSISTATATAFSSLPWDIWNVVCEHAPKPTLVACSCVSRSWRDLARPHLFASITIARGEGDFVDVSEDLCNNFPNVARFIWRLELAHTSDWVAATHPRPVVSHDLLATLLTKLPRLGDICLRSVRIDTEQLQNVDAPTERKLRKLEMVDCEVLDVVGGYNLPDPRVLFHFARALPADTVHIAVYNVIRLPATPAHPEPNLPLLAARSLSIKLRYEERYHTSAPWESSWLCDALRTTLAPNCLTTVYLGFWIRGHDVDCLRRLGRFLLHACSPDLRRLVFPVMICSDVAAGQHHPEKTEYWRVLHLKKFVNIEELEFSLTPPRPGSHFSDADAPLVPLGAVCAAFLALLPPTIRKITIILWDLKEESQMKDKMLGLGVLDDALDARAPTLEKVRLVFRGNWYLLEFATTAMKAMAKCKKRGVLEIMDWFDHIGPTPNL
ncbi:hypothetical protein BN946_scf184592.g6 [Trametes cinnabarina]|uniref:F-box domain-containing protein n=1 Tax=Pycnoporus cinnabarinus TaxID=5643 RepID=A0A060SRU6_PYCCI|nr:hypothetical protein BN946_scf184592.g6 [Trametes cinnabarina]